MPEVLNVLMRWLHLTSVALLIGGILYARLVVAPALPAPSRDSLATTFAQRYKPWLLGAIAALILSGLYNFLTGPPRPSHYHMWFGIKMLLALHVFAVGILLARPQNTRRERRMSGIILSGLAIILISAYLRRL